jgi:hypothetical protein
LKSRLWILALVAAVLAALVAAGCGGKDNDPAAVSLVKQAFSKSIGSADVAVDLNADLQGSQQLKGPLSLKLSGPYASNGSRKLPSFDWAVALAGGGLNFDARLTSTGDDLYVGFQGQSYDVGKATVARYNAALAQGRTTQKHSLKDFGIDPASWVKGATEEGTASVAGTPTKHVSASIDFDALLNDLNTLVRKAGSRVPGAPRPAQLTPSERKQVTDAIKSSSFDVYVGKADGKVRRVALTLEFAVPSKQRSRTSGVNSGTLSFSIQYSNVGRAVTIQAPTNVKPLSDLVAQLGGASGANGSATRPAPTQKQLDAYKKCLDQTPSGDLTALQRCNSLVK